VVGLCFVPSIQEYLVHKVTELVSQQWQSNIHISKIYISPTLEVVFSDLVINDTRQRPMISVKKTKGRIKTVKLKPFTLHFFSIHAEGADVDLIKYTGDESVNVALWARKFKTDKPIKFALYADQLTLKNSRFAYTNEANKRATTPDRCIDYAFFELQNIATKMQNFSVEGADVSANIQKLSLKQYTGFHLLDASALFRINAKEMQFKEGKIVTPNSMAFLNLSFGYTNWGAYSNFTDSVRFEADIKSALLDLRDVACFAPSIQGMNQRLNIEGQVYGPVNKMSAYDCVIRYGEKTEIAGDITLTNIPDFWHSTIDFSCRDSKLDARDLSTFTLPGGHALVLPDMLTRAGTLRVKGQFNGSPSCFSTNLALTSVSLGNVTLQLSCTGNNKIPLFAGHLHSSGFNIGKLLQQERYLGIVSLDAEGEGSFYTPAGSTKRTFASHCTIHIPRFDLLGGTLHDLTLKSAVKNQVITAEFQTSDTALALNVNTTLDISGKEPTLKGQCVMPHLIPYLLAQRYTLADSTSDDSFDKLVHFCQKNKNKKWAFQLLEINVKGKNIETLNGLLALDDLSYSDGEHTINSERLRLTAINTASGLHKWILTSSFANATMTTNHHLSSLIDTLANVAYRYMPNLMPERAPAYPTLAPENNVEERYFKLSIETFRTRDLLALLIPGLQIAPASHADLYISSVPEKDQFSLDTRYVRYKNGIGLYKIRAGSNQSEQNLQLQITGDSLVFHLNKQNISFRDIELSTSIRQQYIQYHLRWQGVNALSVHASQLSGYVDAIRRDSIAIHFDPSALNIRDNIWSFNPAHNVVLRPDHIDFSELILKANRGMIKINGLYSFKQQDNLSIDIKNVDLSQINPFTENLNMTFGGAMSAKIRLGTWKKHRMITGKLLVSDFQYNGETLGHLFLAAAVPESSTIGFGGGLFAKQSLNSENVEQYTIRDYNNEPVKLTNLTGKYEIPKKQLEVKANIDTLRIGFLSPFLRSFSQVVSGTARGELTFRANPDSAYFQGNVTVLNGLMGISALNTVYNIANQTISFDSRGITFDHLILNDIFGNTATLNGHVYHRFFKNMQIDLTIETRKIMALNSKKQSDTYFYGTGFVSGKVNIKGTSQKLSFVGQNITTLSNSKIYLPLTFSEHVSETAGIRFKPVSETIANANPTATNMELDFDFLFNVNKEAEVQIDLDPAIGGTLTARVEGPLHLTYQTLGNLNLLGQLNIASGKFAFSFRDIFNSNFDLEQDGSIAFNGPVDRSRIDARAIYKTSASLQELIPDASSRRVPVNAYLNLTGNLMHPNIGFSFALPNNNEEDNAMLNNAIDISNTNNGARQFISLLLFSKFTSTGNTEDQFGSDIAASTSFEMLSGMLSKLLSQQFKYGDVGVKYQVGDLTHAAEYSVNASIPFLHDRIVINTNIGYADGRNTNNATNASYVIGDVSLEFLLNEDGNWRLKAFYTRNDDNSLSGYDYQSQNGVGGVALIYKKEFNGLKDFLDSFRRKNKKRNKDKKK
jgi:hypothetical protein